MSLTSGHFLGSKDRRDSGATSDDAGRAGGAFGGVLGDGAMEDGGKAGLEESKPRL